MASRTTTESSPVLDAVARAGLEVVDEVSSDELPRTRGGPAGTAQISLGPVPDGEARVVLAQEQGTDGPGLWTWHFAGPTRRRGRGGELVVTVPLTAGPATAVPGEPGAARRGVAMLLAKKVFRVLAVKLVDGALGEIGAGFARRWEQKHRRELLRGFTPADYRNLDVPPLDEGGLAQLAGGRAMLFVHGTMSLSHSGFGRFAPDVLERLHERYEGRVFALDHYTLSKTPTENARWFAEQLPAGAGLEVDILAHSRGGLVSRVLAERPERIGLAPDRLRVRSLTFVATPNAGTPLCQPDHLGSYVDAVTNLFALIPDNPVTDTIDGVITVVKHIAAKAYAGIPGVMAMNPGSDELRELNDAARGGGERAADRPRVVYRALSADYVDASSAGIGRRLRELVVDRVMDGRPNDLIVPRDSVWDIGGTAAAGSLFPIVRHDTLDGAVGVDHSSYWSADASVHGLEAWLTPEGDDLIVVEAPDGTPSPSAGGPDATITAPEPDGRTTTDRHRELVADDPATAEATVTDDAVDTDDGTTTVPVTPTASATVPATATAPTARDVAAPVVAAASALRPRVAIHLEVTHGSLEFATHPLVIGHMRGAPLLGAEGFVDERYDNALSHRQVTGMYPEDEGEVITIRGPFGARPACTLVVGLGELGGLTPSKLSQAMSRAALQRVLDAIEANEGQSDAERMELGISTVLIGTSLTGGLPVHSAIAAIVEGVITANRRLELDHDLAQKARITRIEFIERYGDKAAMAARAVRDVGLFIGGQRAGGFVPDPALVVRMADGGRPGLPPAGYEQGSWERIVIGPLDDDEPHGPLAFTVLGRGAGADRLVHVVEWDLVDELLVELVSERDSSSQVSNTLYELLLPNDLKYAVSGSGNLQLIVNGPAANLPWEVLTVRGSDGQTLEPLAARTGLLRQLEVARTRPQARRSAAANALVIGDPPTGDLERLPAAQAEARAVAEKLRAAGYRVTERIFSDRAPSSAQDVLNDLFAREYQVIHIAAHGSFMPGKPGCSGVLIGPGRFLTARTVGQMRAIPELVFLNCCHLGKVEELSQSTTIAQDLMTEGVRAVVAAGWAVDDEPAKRFAEVLFDDLLAGMLYGDAARHARNLVAQEFRDDDGLTTNTWGAYQCYGDPGFRLVTGRLPKQLRVEAVSADDLAEAVSDVEIQAGDVRRTDSHHDARATLLAELAGHARLAEERGWDDGRLWYAFGQAHYALRSFADAVVHYERALKVGGDVPIQLLERLANAQVRAARNLPDGAQREEHFARAWENIARSRQFGSTAERFALEGSFHKKRAVRLAPDQRADAVRRAAEAYRRADDAEPRPYHALNWAQMAVVGGVAGRRWTARVDAIGGASASGILGGGYWDRAGRADYLLARAVVDARLGHLDVTDAVIAAYQEAFALRSTWANRSSALDHLQDLIDLHPVVAEVEGLRRIEAGLAIWAIAEG